MSIRIAQFTPSAIKVPLELETQLVACLLLIYSHLRVQMVQEGIHRSASGEQEECKHMKRRSTIFFFYEFYQLKVLTEC
jgi:hypothetical protein